ncbi:MAG TPA: retroviral-like aspartic protease family protein [Oligoflexus sp.]|uniref:retroviral-like aspartic protease family protein n=1 Tax=Oligoflexus sp. TaxID=1971216 RepID=UPI002D4EE06F|nr:retroviral-like aspartic protease family protein [Oligoflexus sp.]HYX38259.1 retroviral-like aspartic protease family protein [Oligoflexus sp.]
MFTLCRICVLALSLSLVGACTRDLMTVEFSNVIDREVVPLDKVVPFLIVKATIAGQNRSWIIDTAASRTFIDEGIAESLHLKKMSQATGKDFNGEFPVFEVAAVPIRLGSLTLQSRSFLTMDMTAITRMAGQEIAGILGHDFLSGVIAEFEFASSRIALYDPKKFRLATKPGLSSGYPHRRYAAFRGTINENIEVRWIMDTGSTRSTLHYNFLKRHPELMAGKTGASLNQAAHTRTRLSLLRVPSLQLAGREFRDFELEAADEKSENLVFMNEAVDGILGLDLLRNYRVYLDYKKEIFLLVNKDSTVTGQVLESQNN